MKANMMPQCKDSAEYSFSAQQKQFWEQMLHTVNDAKMHHTIIELTLYDELEELKVIGTIEQIDTPYKRIKIDGEWFSLDRVIAVNS